MTALLSRAAILAAPVPTVEVDVPEWNGVVRVRALSAKSRVLLLDAIYANDADHQAWKDDQAKPMAQRAGLPRVDLYDQSILTVLFGIVDDAGDLLFTLSDYAAFTELNYPTIARLWVAIRDLANHDADDLKKSLGKTRKGASSSASRSRSVKQ